MTEEEKSLLEVLAVPENQAKFIDYLAGLGVAPDERMRAILKALPPVDEAGKAEIPHSWGKLGENEKRLVNGVIATLTE